MTAMSVGHESLDLAQRCKARWQALAYRNRAAEWTLYALAFSGLPLIAAFSVDWQWQRWDLVAHALLGTFGFITLIVPFWSSHRRLLLRSRKSFLRMTGRITEVLLLVTGASGYYLILWGNRGGSLGNLVHQAHLIASLSLTLVVMRHAWRWSVLQPLWKRLGLGAR